MYRVLRQRDAKTIVTVILHWHCAIPLSKNVRTSPSLTLCFAHSRQTAAQPMFPTFQKLKCRPLHWTPPCWRSSSKSKKPCASTRTRPFLQDKNKLSCQTIAYWYWSKQADRADRSYFYLPIPQNLSTKSARAVENLNRPGAVVLPFWGHFGVKVTRLLPLLPYCRKKLVETCRFNELLLVAETGLEPATSGL